MFDFFIDFSPLSKAQTALGVLSRPPRVTNGYFQIALHRRDVRMLVFDDFEGFLAEAGDDALCQRGADVLDGAGGEKSLDSLGGRGDDVF